MSTNENRRAYALKAYEKKKTLYKKNLKKKKITRISDVETAIMKAGD